MNGIITEFVTYRGKQIPVCELKDKSQIEVEITCRHGNVRVRRWCRRHQWCYQCNVEAGAYNTSPKGRVITWGNKISNAKKGKKFSRKHKQALVSERKKKYCKRVGIDESDFVEFSSYSAGRFNFSFLVRQCIIYNWNIDSITVSELHKDIFDVLKWTMLEFKEHMEKQFEQGMTWSDYGFWGWHVDHIKPVSLFHIVSINDDAFMECWSLSNLQPLWASDNFKKNNKYEQEEAT